MTGYPMRMIIAGSPVTRDPMGAIGMSGYHAGAETGGDDKGDKY